MVRRAGQTIWMMSSHSSPRGSLEERVRVEPRTNPFVPARVASAGVGWFHNFPLGTSNTRSISFGHLG